MEDFIDLAIIYIGIHVIRGFIILVLFPLMKKIGYGITKKDSIVLWWGGLRGVIGLAMALIVAGESSIAQDVRDQFLFITAGIVLLTSLINATTIKFLVKSLGLTRIPVAKATLIAHSIEKLKVTSEMRIDLMKKDRFMGGADWSTVEKFLPKLWEPNKEDLLRIRKEFEIDTAEIAKNTGLNVTTLSLSDLKKTEPNVTINAKGAVYYKCDSHSTPSEFMEEMKAYLISSGVQIFKNEKVEDFEVSEGKIITIKTKGQILKADEFVLAAGCWSSFLTKKLGLNILLQAGKGYRINTENETGISIPAILAEKKVAVTPMNGFTRFAGTMEIAEINNKLNGVRVDAIANAVSQYYPEIELSKEEKENASSGLRPLSFDGLPYIGKSVKCNNLTIATGHAMMGWTMATATGKLVSEIISNKKSSINLEPFSVDRKN